MVSPEAFRDSILRGVEDIGKTLKGDDDWTPCLLMETERGFNAMPLVTEDGRVLDQLEMLKLVPPALTEIRPTIVCKVQTGWMRAPDEEPHQRNEVVIVQVYAKGVSELWMAGIDRSGKRPQVGEWEQAEQLESPIGDALQMVIEQSQAA
jgi:hypothetical protein